MTFNEIWAWVKIRQPKICPEMRGPLGLGLYYVYTTYMYIIVPVEPHKAVAEVSNRTL